MRRVHTSLTPWKIGARGFRRLGKFTAAVGLISSGTLVGADAAVPWGAVYAYRDGNYVAVAWGDNSNNGGVWATALSNYADRRADGYSAYSQHDFFWWEPSATTGEYQWWSGAKLQTSRWPWLSTNQETRSERLRSTADKFRIANKVCIDVPTKPDSCSSQAFVTISY